MDTGKGRFEITDKEALDRFVGGLSTQEEKLKAQQLIFHVGEEVAVKGSRFIIARITPKKMVLKLLHKGT